MRDVVRQLVSAVDVCERLTLIEIRYDGETVILRFGDDLKTQQNEAADEVDRFFLEAQKQDSHGEGDPPYPRKAR